LKTIEITSPESIAQLKEIEADARLDLLAQLVATGLVHFLEAEEAWMASGGHAWDVATLEQAHRSRSQESA
jgi:hypothetical protein